MDAILAEALVRLRAAAEEGRRLNYSPYSGLLFLAAAETVSAGIAGASNVENGNYSLTKHAEELAIMAAFERAGENPAPGRLRLVYVAGTRPCGSCRQFASEFGAEGGLWIIERIDQERLRACSLVELPLDADVVVLPFADALPRPWTAHEHGA